MLMLMLRWVHYLGRNCLGRRRIRFITPPDPRAPLSPSTMMKARNGLFGPCTSGTRLSASSKSVRSLRHTYTTFFKAKNQ